jgi:hypothetical protein
MQTKHVPLLLQQYHPPKPQQVSMLHKVRAETTGSISHGMLQYEQQITKYTDEQQKYMMVLFWLSLT